MSKNKYSILMSVYYKEKPDFLRLAIESMLNQTVKADEFIIIKDGNLTQDLEEVINEFQIANPNLFTILKNETNLGLGPSLRKGINISRNELIARMDSDDYSLPNRCEEQLKIFEEDNKIGMVGTFEDEFVDSIDNVVSIHRVPENNEEILNFMRRRCAILHPTVMYKKSAVQLAGNYQDKSYYPIYEDYDLFARMVFKAKIKCYNIQKSLYYIRTSNDFFERRGGFKYALTSLRFKWNLCRKKYITIIDFIISGIGQFIVCLLPNKLRKIFYMKVLRK